MTQTSRFCDKCGAPLNADARFCGQCGQTVQTPAAPPAAASTEPVIGVIAALQRRKGLLGYQNWNLVVTPKRLIFALMTKEVMNDAVRQARDQAKSEGKGFLGQIAAQAGWVQLIVDQYAARPVEQTLAEQPDNFSLLPGQIKKVKLEREHDQKRHMTTLHLNFETTSGTFEFTLMAGGLDEARQILTRVLGTVVH